MKGARIRIRPEPSPAEAEAVRRALEALGLIERAGAEVSQKPPGSPAPAGGGLSPVDGEPAP